MLQCSMSLIRPYQPNRYNPECLYRPRSLVVIGAASREGALVLDNLRTAGFTGDITAVDRAEGFVQPNAPADLAVLATGTAPIGPVLATLAAGGTFAAVATGMTPDIAAASAATGVRVLGPGSFGVACPSIGLNATLSHLTPKAGRVALVSQSAALCRAVLDWAEPNGVGFSHVIGVGGNAGVGFAQALDYLSRDPGTGSILLDIRRIRDRRAFMSAARAAARQRPIVAIRAGGRLQDATGRAEAVFDVALHRAGILTVSHFDDFLTAAETVARARPARGEALAIVTNAIGPGQMAADAALAGGLRLVELAPETQNVLRLALPTQTLDGLLYVGVQAPTRLAETAALLSGAREVGGVIVVFAPTGPEDDAGIAALAAAAKAMKAPLLVCAMGETTGAAHRHALAEAGVPAFASPEQAVHGFLHLVGDRRARAAARELPSSKVLSIAPDRATVRAEFARARAAGESADAPVIFGAYGILIAPAGPGAEPGLETRIAAVDDAMFGPTIAFGLGGEAADLMDDRAVDLPPLNLALAQALVQRTRAGRLLANGHDGAKEERAAIADMLVRISQMLVDFPEIGTVELNPVVAGAGGARAAAGSIGLRPPGEAGWLAIAPYPAELVETWQSGDETLCLRPIRPEDAEGHAALFLRLTPDDIRYRFFTTLRELSPERIARMTQVDYDREMAFVAIRSRPDALDETVGVSRLVRDGPDEGEFAVVVQGDMKGHGLGRKLMQCLFAWAASRDVREITGQVLADNHPMLAFVRKLGFQVERMPDEADVVMARMTLTPATPR